MLPIFGPGGGVSLYAGVQHARHPEPMRDPMWTCIVLGAAAVFEGASLTITLRQFLNEAGATAFRAALHRSVDPLHRAGGRRGCAGRAARVAVGMVLGHRFAMPELEGVASLVIGVLRAGVAIRLIQESRWQGPGVNTARFRVTFREQRGRSGARGAIAAPSRFSRRARS